MVRWFSVGKKVIVSEKNPQSQCHVSVSQAVDERVQHGGDHCVHHRSNDVFVMRLAKWGGKVQDHNCPIE